MSPHPPVIAGLVRAAVMRSVALVATLLALAGCQRSANPRPVTAAAQTQFTERHRPQFHFTPPAKWMNDPNGMVFYEGEYHLFYQHHPDSTVWGPMHWGHAVSTDLVHWQHLPIALFPDALGLIFSGSAVIDWKNTSGFGINGKPPMVAMFTYHDMAAEKRGTQTFQTQGLAYSNDRGRTWTKYTGNPVIPNAGIRDFRDTKVIWHEASQRWIMVLAAGDRIRLYASYDLTQWEFASEFGVNVGAHGGVWECPDLFPIRIEGTNETRWVLLVSINPGGPNGGSATQYFVGSFDGTTFTLDPQFATGLGTAGKEPTRGIWVDHGRDDYAGVTWSDIPSTDGRRLFIGWMSNWDYAAVVPTDAWRSAMTIPRSLTLRRTPAGLRLFSTPVSELRLLRGETRTLTAQRISGTVPLRLPSGGTAAQSEIDLEFFVSPNDTTDVAVELSNAAGETYRIGFNQATGRYYSDRTALPRAFSAKFATAVHWAPRIVTDSVVRMHLFFDRASAELFGDGGATALTDIMFPTEDFSTIRMVVKGDAVRLRYANISALVSMWR